MKKGKLNFTMMKGKMLDTLLKRIGSLLSEFRIRKGYNTIKDFVTAYNLPMIQYWRIEKGKANVTMKTLLHILTIHRIEVGDFFSLIQNSEWKKKASTR